MLYKIRDFYEKKRSYFEKVIPIQNLFAQQIVSKKTCRLNLGSL